jgi:hypothetical protein
MDTDPPLTVDFIFYRVGKGEQDPEKHVKVVNSARMGAVADPNDP